MQHALRPCEMTQCILMRNQRREQADSLVFDSRFPHFLKQFLKAAPVAKSLPNAQQIRANVLLWFLSHSQSSNVSSHACIPSCACMHLHSRRGRSIPLSPVSLVPSPALLRLALFLISFIEKPPNPSHNHTPTLPKLPIEEVSSNPCAQKKSQVKPLGSSNLAKKAPA